MDEVYHILPDLEFKLTCQYYKIDGKKFFLNNVPAVSQRPSSITSGPALRLTT